MSPRPRPSPPLLPLATAARADAGFAELALTMFAELLPRATLADLSPPPADLRPGLVVHEQSDAGAGAAAQRAGIAAVSHVIGRSIPPPLLAAAAGRLAGFWTTTPADPLLGDACAGVWPDSVRDLGPAALPAPADLVAELADRAS